jgi:hypothetical protein
VSSINGDGEAPRSSWQRPDAPLGTLIFREGLLSAEQLEDALGESVKRGKRLGQVLVERGLLEEAQVARILARQKGLDYVDLRETAVDPAAASLLSSETAWLTHAVPIAVVEGTPVVAVEDPGDEEALKTVAETLGTQPRFAVATRSEILRVLGTVSEGSGSAGATPPPVVAAPPVQPAPEPQPVVALQEPVGPAPQAVVAEASGLRVAAPPPEAPVDSSPQPLAEAFVNPTASVPPVEVAPQPVSVVEARPEPEPVPAAPAPAPEPPPAGEPAPVAAPMPAAPAEVSPAQPVAEPAPVEPAPPAEPAPVLQSAPAPVEPAQQLVTAPEPLTAEAAEPVAPAAETDTEPVPALEAPIAAATLPGPEAVPASPEEPSAAPSPSVVEVPTSAAPAAEPAPAQEPPQLEVVPPPAPESEPQPELEPAAEAPAAVQAAEPQPEPAVGEVRVVVRLADGGEIEVDAFSSLEEAKGAAKLLSRQIGTAAPGEWPHVGGRFVRPDLIISVDVV